MSTTKSKHGKVLTAAAPTATALEPHRKAFGAESVDIAAEKRDVAELRESGMSVREIARVRGISERRVKAQLRLAA